MEAAAYIIAVIAIGASAYWWLEGTLNEPTATHKERMEALATAVHRARTRRIK